MSGPVEKGDWMVERDVQHPGIGKVRAVYYDTVCSEWVMDITLYDPDGNRIGRRSPRMGGPSGFEPAVPCSTWFRIKRPSFPLPRDRSGFRDWRSALVVAERLAGERAE